MRPLASKLAAKRASILTKIIALSLLLFVIGCAGSLPSEDTSPVSCFGFQPDDFPIVSDNYCLDTPWTTANVGLIQAVPDGFEIVNILENADGFQDEYTDRARIECDQYSCQFQLHNGVVGLNGTWGYEQTVEVEAGCHLVKATGYNSTNDPLAANEMNYFLLGYVNDEQIGAPIIATQGPFEIIFPVMLESGEVTFTVLVAVGWATPGHNSYLDLIGLGLLAVPDGYCN